MAEMVDIRALNERIERQSAFVDALVMGMDRVIVGQKHLVESLLIGLLSDGHVLLEGVPGLAKTLAIKTLAELIEADFSRIQFTPDLLPADVVGTLIYSQKKDEFSIKKGPIFANFVLADETVTDLLFKVTNLSCICKVNSDCLNYNAVLINKNEIIALINSHVVFFS